MRLIRYGIALCIIALFLPGTPEEKQQLYNGVSGAVESVQTFCVRHASLCDNVETIAESAVDRAYYGAQIIYDAAMGREHGGADQQGRDRPYPESRSRDSRHDSDAPPSRSAQSTDTLRPQDRQPAWRGPGSS